MNIFSLPVSLYYDAHVNKMCIETTQLLYFVWYWAVGQGTVHESMIPHPEGKAPYRINIAHMKHPCTKWARSSPSHYMWLCKLGLEICAEYTFRYKKVHACESHIQALMGAVFPPLPPSALNIEHPPLSTSKKEKDIVPAYDELPGEDMQWFALAITDSQYHAPAGRPSAVESYMRYFLSKAQTMKLLPHNKRVKALLDVGKSKDEIVSQLLSVPSVVNMPARLASIAADIVGVSIDAANKKKAGAKLVLKRKKKEPSKPHLEPLMPVKKQKRSSPSTIKRKKKEKKEKEWWETDTHKRMYMTLKEKKEEERRMKKARRMNPRSDSYKFSQWISGRSDAEPNWAAMRQRIKDRHGE